MTTVRPRLEDCVDLYLAAHDRYGTDTFTADAAEAEFAGASGRLLELAVAYGLLSYDGDAYRVELPPGADADRWEARLADRASLLRRTITARREGGTAAGGEVVTLPFDDQQFASVFVDGEEFEDVVDAVGRLDLDGRDGVVLRTPGPEASTVQRIADRLCDATTPEDSPLGATFQKAGTDVVGADKNELEFRLFLTRD